MNDWITILDDIECESASKKKGKLLNQGISEYPDFEKFLKLTFNPDITLNIDSKTIQNALSIKTNKNFKDIGDEIKWYIKSNSLNKSLIDMDEKKEHTFDDFIVLYNDLLLSRGDLTKTKLNKFFMKCNPDDAKWYSRCLVKDLSCGISIISVNKQLKLCNKEIIQKFTLQLAKPIKNNELITKINSLLEENKVLYSDPKFDGVRLWTGNTKSPDKSFQTLSRNGKPILNTQNIIYEAQRIFGNKYAELDGELIADGFYTLSTTIHSKNDTATIVPRKYMIFDILRLGDDDLTILPFTKRKEILEKLIPKDSLIFEVVKTTPIKTANEAIELFNTYIKEGHEGSILKEDKPYTFKREYFWKIKPFHTLDLRIIDFDYATEGKYSGKRSSIIVTDASGRLKSKGRKEGVSVGSGLSENDIIMFNIGEEKDWYEKIVEIKFDAITPDMSLRFPRFIRLRDDKDEADSL